MTDQLISIICKDLIGLIDQWVAAIDFIGFKLKYDEVMREYHRRVRIVDDRVMYDNWYLFENIPYDIVHFSNASLWDPL